jgi:hypothetical protein
MVTFNVAGIVNQIIDDEEKSVVPDDWNQDVATLAINYAATDVHVVDNELKNFKSLFTLS